VHDGLTRLLLRRGRLLVLLWLRRGRRMCVAGTGGRVPHLLVHLGLLRTIRGFSVGSLGVCSATAFGLVETLADGGRWWVIIILLNASRTSVGRLGRGALESGVVGRLGSPVLIQAVSEALLLVVLSRIAANDTEVPEHEVGDEHLLNQGAAGVG
jgi:hypothetical protein